jgi:hypothetical protein
MEIKEMKKLNFILSIMVLSLTVNSCSKDDNGSSYPLMIRMTDSQGSYNAIFIDLQGIEITGSDGKSELMSVNKGIYNLADLSNGIDTLIGIGSLNVANLEQIRLILGSNNSIVVNSVRYPLITPSAQESGLKLQINQPLQQDVFVVLLINFDINQSIVVVGNGNFILKPVIKTVKLAMVDETITPDDNEILTQTQFKFKFPKRPKNDNWNVNLSLQ